MRGVYEASYKIATVTAAKTLMYLTAPSNKVVQILEAHVTNYDNETNEQMEFCLQKVNALGTPTATTVTPAKTELGDQAAASTVKANVTASEPSYVADTEIGRDAVASLNGWHFEPEEDTYIAGGDTWGLRHQT